MTNIQKGTSAVYDLLIDLLRTENNYVSDNGELKKRVVSEEARKYSST